MSNMKNNRGGAIVKLVIWSVVLIILAAIFALGLIFKNGFTINGSTSFSIISSYTYENAEKYSAGNTSYTGEVKELDIEWTAGDVKIVVYDGDEIKLEESGAGERGDNKMRTYLDNGTLHIRYARSGIRLFSDIPTKKLTVSLPEKYASALYEINIKAVSANISSEGMIVCREISIESVSGKINLNGISAEDSDISTVSGNILIAGDISELDVKGVSAKLELMLQSTPRSIAAETVSGNVDITLADSTSGFKAELDSLSGKLKVGGENAGKVYKHKDGMAEFEFESISGNVTIVFKGN